MRKSNQLFLDNEYGYSTRVVELLAFAAKKDGAL